LLAQTNAFEECTGCFIWNPSGTTTIPPSDDYASWVSDGSTDTDSLISDPLFQNAASSDFRLQKTSPCVDEGIGVGLRQDYAGISVPFGAEFDIGAYELEYSLLIRKPISNRGNYASDSFDSAGQRINQARPTPGDFEMPLNKFEEGHEQ